MSVCVSLHLLQKFVFVFLGVQVKLNVSAVSQGKRPVAVLLLFETVPVVE